MVKKEKLHLNFLHIRKISIALILAGLWVTAMLTLTPTSSNAANTPIMSSNATISFDPVDIQIGQRDTFTTAFKIAAGPNAVDRVELFVDFDPTYIQVISITGGNALSETGQGWHNISGTLFYSAVNMTTTISGTFTVAEVIFQSQPALVTETLLQYSTLAPRETLISAGGLSLTLETQPAAVTINGPMVSLHTYTTTVQENDTFTTDIQIAADTQSVNGAQIYLDFDPTALQLTQITGTSILSTELTNTYDNALGQATYIVTGQNMLSGTFDLATLTFEAMTATAQTTMTLHTLPPRETTLFSRPITIACAVQGISIRIIEQPELIYALYLPIVLRSNMLPARPTNVKATALSYTEAKVTWRDNATNETGFTIYEGSNQITDVVANVTSYTMTGLTPGDYYCFNVYAFNDYGRSDWSDWGCVVMPEPGPTCTETLLNGGFETDAAWILPITPFPAQYATATVRTGNRALQTGIFSSTANVESYSSARQAVTIPTTLSTLVVTDVISAHLRLWVAPYTTESNARASSLARPPHGVTLENWHPAAQTDAHYIVILDADLQVLETLLWERYNIQNWTHYEFDLLAYVGQPIQVLIGSYNDGLGGITGMFVDDVSLEVCSP